MLRFLALLLAQGRQRLAAETADTQRLKTLLQWLSAHYTEELRVADAAGVCSFSASHFMRWLGWPNKTEELDYFYPNDVLEREYENLPIEVNG